MRRSAAGEGAAPGPGRGRRRGAAAADRSLAGGGAQVPARGRPLEEPGEGRRRSAQGRRDAAVGGDAHRREGRRRDHAARRLRRVVRPGGGPGPQLAGGRPQGARGGVDPAPEFRHGRRGRGARRDGDADPSGRAPPAGEAGRQGAVRSGDGRGGRARADGVRPRGARSRSAARMDGARPLADPTGHDGSRRDAPGQAAQGSLPRQAPRGGGQAGRPGALRARRAGRARPGAAGRARRRARRGRQDPRGPRPHRLPHLARGEAACARRGRRSALRGGELVVHAGHHERQRPRRAAAADVLARTEGRPGGDVGAWRRPAPLRRRAQRAPQGPRRGAHPRAAQSGRQGGHHGVHRRSAEDAGELGERAGIGGAREQTSGDTRRADGRVRGRGRSDVRERAARLEHLRRGGARGRVRRLGEAGARPLRPRGGLRAQAGDEREEGRPQGPQRALVHPAHHHRPRAAWVAEGDGRVRTRS